MKDIVPELIKILQNKRSLDDDIHELFRSCRSEIMSMQDVSDELIHHIVHSNFGTSFMVGENEKVTGAKATKFMTEVNGTLVKTYSLEFDTKVGIIATEPVMFYYNNTEYVKDSIYVLNAFSQATWKDGVIVVNPNKVNMEMIKPEHTIKTQYSHQPLFFDAGSQYVMDKTYLGYNKKENPNSVIMELSDNNGYVPQDRCPITSNEDVNNVGIYKHTNHQNVWQRVFNVSNNETVAAWVFRKQDFYSFSGYTNRRFTEDAAEFVNKSFKTFKV